MRWVDRHAAVSTLALALFPGSALLAEQTVPSVTEQLEAQDQRIRVLERKLELAEQASATTAGSAPTVKASASGFSLSSADGQNAIKLRGTLNVDGRYFKSFDDTANLTNGVAGTSAYQSADGFLLRKVRPYLEGTLNGIYDWRLQPELGGGKATVLDSYVAARFKPWAVVTIGKFKNPVGLERLQTDAYNKFIELGFPSSLLPNRDIGVQISGSVFSGSTNYAVGVFDGVIDGSSSDSNPSADADSDGKHEFAGRLFVLPFIGSDNFYLRGLGIGLSATTGSKHGTADISTRGTTFSGTTQVVSFVSTNTWLPTYRTAAQQTLFSYRSDNADTLTVNEATYADGRHTRLAPQAYYYYGPLGVLAEYAQSTQRVSRHVNATTMRADTLSNSAWQLAVSYFLTGEDAAYNGVTPLRNFAPGKSGAGAWEVAVRYQQLNIDDAAFVGGSASFANPQTAASAATGYSVALNWYLSQAVRVSLEYDLTQFTGGAARNGIVVDRNNEQAYVTRFAVNF
jgi:phosphate-selective porin OprO and OprP